MTAIRQLRTFTAALRRRLDDAPRLPFAVTVAIAALLLAVALEAHSEIDARVTEAGELDGFQSVPRYSSVEVSSAVDVEILEYGFGAVTDPEGKRRITLGAIVFNPHESERLFGTLLITSPGDSGTRETLESVYTEQLLPGSTMRLGYVLTTPYPRLGDLDEQRLELEIGSSSTMEITTELTPEELERVQAEQIAMPWPKVTVVEIEPLYAPPGQRIVYEVDSGIEPTSYWLTDIVFRDGDGEIVGGLSSRPDQFGLSNEDQGYRTAAFAPGVSIRHLDLPAEQIPEGADLGRTEIGVSG